VVSEQANGVQVPGLDAYLGILPGHSARPSLLGSGCLSWGAAGERRYLAVQGGLVEILPGR